MNDSNKPRDINAEFGPPRWGREGIRRRMPRSKIWVMSGRKVKLGSIAQLGLTPADFGVKPRRPSKDELAE